MIYLLLKNEKGIQDYDIDLWIGIFSNNPDIVKNAIENGANVNIKIDELLEKYNDYE